MIWYQIKSYPINRIALCLISTTWLGLCASISWKEKNFGCFELRFTYWLKKIKLLYFLYNQSLLFHILNIQPFSKKSHDIFTLPQILLNYNYYLFFLIVLLCIKYILLTIKQEKRNIDKTYIYLFWHIIALFTIQA